MFDPECVVLDATVPNPVNKEKAPGPNKINGARFFDLDGAFSDLSQNLPHMLCSEDQFTESAQQLGLNQNSQVVVYDDHGVFSSPRAWYMLTAMGLKNVRVLNGGLPAWEAAGYAVEHKQVAINLSIGNFIASYQQNSFINAQQVLDSVKDVSSTLLDARSKPRFYAEAPEPRPGLRGGHIPNSICLPFTQLVHQGHLLPKKELVAILETLVPSKSQHLQLSCGSGLTACILALAAKEAGYNSIAVYDGSWSEWGQPSELPVSTK